MKRLLVVVVAVAAYLAIVFAVSKGSSPTARITGFDMLALPGETIELRALMEKDGPTLFRPNFAGIEVQFYLRGRVDRFPLTVTSSTNEGTKIGERNGESDGYVAISYQAPAEPGSYRIDVRLANPAELELNSTNNYLLLTVMPAERAIIATAIDRTLCHPTSATAAVVTPPLNNASEVLNKAASDAQVVYITERPVHRALETRNWLSEFSFPPGPVLFRENWYDPAQTNIPESYFKALFLVRQVQPKWSNVAWGIAKIPEDGEAYSANGIRPILVQPENLIGAGAQLRAVEGWSEVGVIFENEGFRPTSPADDVPTEDR